MRVTDDGAGPAPGFTMESSDRARPVDRAHPRRDRAGRLHLDAQERPGPGTVVELHIPVARTWPEAVREAARTVPPPP